MRKVLNQLVLAGSFSGCILSASVGVGQQTANWPWRSESGARASVQSDVRHVAWDQLPNSGGSVAPAVRNGAGLLGDVDFESIPWVDKNAASNEDVIVQELPWKAVSPQLGSQSASNPETLMPEAANAIPWEAVPTGGVGMPAQMPAQMIGPADFQPERLEYNASAAQVPWRTPVKQLPSEPVASQVAQPEVSLIPFGLAKQTEDATSVFSPSLAAASSPSDRSVPQLPYVLENVRAPKQQAIAEESLIPIDILPFSRLVSTDTAAAQDVKYSTASMVGPLGDASFMFTKLNIENDFRSQPSIAASAVRTSAGMSGYDAEWMHSSYAWVTPTFYHRPLYFEQPNLERYGIGKRRVLQPVYSAAHFFGSIGLLPYKLLTQHPGEHVYTLGNNRPGDCVPYQGRTLLGQSYPLEALRYFEDYSGYR